MQLKDSLQPDLPSALALADLSSLACNAYAARCALRVFPVLGLLQDSGIGDPIREKGLVHETINAALTAYLLAAGHSDHSHSQDLVLSRISRISMEADAAAAHAATQFRIFGEDMGAEPARANRLYVLSVIAYSIARAIAAARLAATVVHAPLKSSTAHQTFEASVAAIAAVRLINAEIAESFVRANWVDFNFLRNPSGPSSDSQVFLLMSLPLTPGALPARWMEIVVKCKMLLNKTGHHEISRMLDDWQRTKVDVRDMLSRYAGASEDSLQREISPQMVATESISPPIPSVIQAPSVTPNSPNVFISYSHDSAQHKQWVLRLATLLCANGVDTILDVWGLHPGQDAGKFMELSVAKSRRVLMICTEKYVEKADSPCGGGVGYEAMVITGELMAQQDTKKFIPVIRQHVSPPSLPRCVSTRLHINFSDDSLFAEQFDDLLREILEVPKFVKPPVGSIPGHLTNLPHPTLSANPPFQSQEGSRNKLSPPTQGPHSDSSIPNGYHGDIFVVNGIEYAALCPKCGNDIGMPGAQCDNCGLASAGTPIRRST